MPGKELKVLCIIPARFKSRRFPGKPLAKINGIPMIKRTYAQAFACPILTKVVVATEDKRIFDYCVSESLNVVMTTDKCLTGTDRLAEVIMKPEYENYDFYFNIQGDEPVIDTKTINEIFNEYKKFGDKYIAYNLYKFIDNKDEIINKALVKVVVNEHDELMYMSRLPIPYSNSALPSLHKMQVPVYGYTANSLKVFSEHNKTINEKFEDVEILRFVDLGYKIKMLETKATSIAVDIPDDIIKVEIYLNS